MKTWLVRTLPSTKLTPAWPEVWEVKPHQWLVMPPPDKPWVWCVHPLMSPASPWDGQQSHKTKNWMTLDLGPLMVLWMVTTTFLNYIFLHTGQTMTWSEMRHLNKTSKVVRKSDSPPFWVPSAWPDSAQANLKYLHLRWVQTLIKIILKQWFIKKSCIRYPHQRWWGRKTSEGWSPCYIVTVIRNPTLSTSRDINAFWRVTSQ